MELREQLRNLSGGTLAATIDAAMIVVAADGSLAESEIVGLADSLNELTGGIFDVSELCMLMKDSVSRLAEHGDDALIPALAALADELAAAGFESSHVGPAGAPSEAYAIFAKLEKAAPADALLGLLRHESAVVRAYVAEHVARSLPEQAGALAGVVLDTTPLTHRSGCMYLPTTLSETTLSTLALNLAHPEVQALLLGACASPAAGAPGAAALALAAPQRPREAVERAKVWLAEALDEETRAKVVGALGASGSGSGEALDLLEPEARHADARVRQAAAEALFKFDSPPALALAERLLSDPDARVVSGAALAYLAHPGRDPARARALAAEGDRAGEMIRLGYPTAEALEAFERQTLEAPANAEPLSRLLSLRPIRDEITECVRRIAAKLEPERSGAYASARTEAIVYLYQVASPRDLPEMRRSLGASSRREGEYARKAIVEQGDHEAVPLLVAKLADDSDDGKAIYAEALLSLGARDAADAIERAAEAAGPPTAAKLREVASRLRGPPAERLSVAAKIARFVWGLLKSP